MINYSKYIAFTLFVTLSLMASGCSSATIPPATPTKAVIAPTATPTQTSAQSSPLAKPAVAESAQTSPLPVPSGFKPSGVAEMPPAQRADVYKAKPAMTIDPQKTYRAVIQTSKGDIVVSLDAKASPEHVNNFVFLSRDGFYKGLTFHRVEPGFVIQGGDPSGNGTGGPGYTVPGEFSLLHIEGALAMARRPNEVNPQKESSGSQFYITLTETPFLNGDYSVFGKVEQGMEIVRAIKVGDTINDIIIMEQ